MKVLIVAEKDQGGSGRQMVLALRSIGVDASIVVKYPHQYGYKYDHILRGPEVRRIKAAKELLKGVDILHFKGDQLPGAGWLKPFLDVAKCPVVMTAGGSGFRRKGSGPDNICLQWYPIQRYRSRVDAMSAITPDLMYEPDIRLIPHAIGPLPQKDVFNDIPIIGHSPSNRDKKGTNDVFLPALDILKTRGYRFDVMMIEGVDHRTCLGMKSKCDLFFDQAICDAYGNSAVEAMIMGVPTATRMSEATRTKDLAYQNSPVAFFEGADPEQAADAMASILDDGLKKRSLATLDWARGLHSYSSVASRLLSLYEDASFTKASQVHHHCRW